MKKLEINKWIGLAASTEISPHLYTVPLEHLTIHKPGA